MLEQHTIWLLYAAGIVTERTTNVLGRMQCRRAMEQAQSSLDSYESLSRM
jgi:hypothetical protein